MGACNNVVGYIKDTGVGRLPSLANLASAFAFFIFSFSEGIGKSHCSSVIFLPHPCVHSMNRLVQ